MRYLYLLPNLLALILMLSASSSWSQLAADPTASAADGVALILGEDSEAQNVTSSGNANQVGTFTCAGCGVNFASGMILATGNVDVAEGPNNSGTSTLGGGNFGASDPDLAIANPNFGLNDAAVVEFDFVAQGDSVRFNYVFASEEYPEFALSSFNDAFGLFLSGPGINGPYSNNGINIALLPGTNLPVTINNVNAGNNDLGCTNCEFYVINTNNNGPLSTQFDGFTVPLEASYDELICGETYHIKIAIADAGDTGYDSAVFIEANSFTLPGIEVTLDIGNVSSDENTLIEGCGSANVLFQRTGEFNEEQEVQITVSGSALNGVDYTAIPETIVFGIGQSDVVVPLIPILDGVAEGVESIVITYSGVGECSTFAEQSIELFITDVAPLEVEVEDVFINCNETATLVPQISGGYGVYTINWPGYGTDQLLEVSPSETTVYQITVQDTCGIDPVNASATVHLPVLPELIALPGDPIGIDCLTELATTGSAEGGEGTYTFAWFAPDGSLLSESPEVEYIPEEEGSLTLQVNDGCGNVSSAELPFFFNDVPISLSLPENMAAPCLEVVTIEPTVLEGGIGDLSLSWTVDGLPAGFAPGIEFTMEEEVEVALLVEDQCGNSAQSSITVALTPSPIDLELPSAVSANCLEAFMLEPETLNGGVGGLNFQWLVDGINSGNGENLNLVLTEGVEVSLVVTDGCGNTAQDVSSVLIEPETVTVDLGEDLTQTCLDASTLVPLIEGGTAAYSYDWILNNASVGSANNYTVQVDETSTVVLTVTDACGNQGSDVLTVAIPQVSVSLELGEGFVAPCNSNVVLVPDLEGGVGNFSYEWLLNGFDAGSDDQIDFTAVGTMNVTLTVSDQCGNQQQDAVTITIPENPPALAITPDTVLCKGDIAELSVEVLNPIGNYQYLWLPGGQTTPSIFVNPTVATTYTVTVADACQEISQASVNLAVDEVQANFDFTYLDDWSITTFNTSYPSNASFLWEFGDGSTSTAFDTSHVFTSNETQLVTLHAETELGCRDSISGTFNPLMSIFVPNVFTPNGDGINDVFLAKGHDIRQFEMWVFNRWGEEVFYTNNIHQPWLGEVNGGSHFGQNEAYTWVVKAVGMRMTSIEESGTVLLIR